MALVASDVSSCFLDIEHHDSKVPYTEDEYHINVGKTSS